ncbi:MULTISPECIES: transporter substrate-binding domain-containing protein [unclassified Psychrobacter]|uniref:substrate-binding periplasmic protein n=1 Tax=unclassified Psychrobacter TaxID=196806 RepID=UPI0025B37D56|nr:MULTISPECIES: transporter substrate-binding domain-containing protein [unclassified Psychrobacter]MDN3452293.1 transporter substrate-binding domain-containing protein [Psychrobacter sp. APC 3350]MDN3502785.1 transporter substrate-binding domain-containing protein [Psychrobacter sp. 5A.1]
MMQLYRVLPMVLSIGLFGCGNSATQENAGTAVTENTDSFVSKLPDTAPIVKVATTGTMPPFSFQDDYGNMQGIDIDSIRAIGEEQGFKVEFYKETWQDMFDSVESGSRDLAISGISYKDDRAARYGLSDSYFFNPSAVMYAKSNLNINSLGDLKGLHVAGMEESKQVEQVKETGGYSELSTTVTTFLLFEDLIQGKVDAIVQDLPLLRYTAANHPEHKVVIVPYEDESNPAAQQVILMAKSNKELIGKVNEGITKLKTKGTFKEIEGRWLGGNTSSETSDSETTNKQLN